MKKLNDLLARGLIAGYGDKSTFEKVNRGKFLGDQSSAENGNYLDQWFAHLRGGGQELVTDGETSATRLYAGGTIDEEELTRLGTTKEAVSNYLKSSITRFGEKTRLDKDCVPDPDGDWQYSYRIIRSIEEIELTLGLESITFKGVLVFAHGFLLSPVK